MYSEVAITSLLKQELRNILTNKYCNEVEQELDKLINNSIIPQKRGYYINLQCKNFERQSWELEYYINIDKLKPGKIIKMSAQNQRYKTTAILIIAILLGYYVQDDNREKDIMFTVLSFQDKKEILNNDRLIQRLDNLKNVIFNFDNNSEELYENKLIEFEIGNEEQQILKIHIDNEEITVVSYEKNEKKFTIEGEKTYYEYLEYILSLSLFNVHLVSKGRNFAKYVLVEETKKYWSILEKFQEILKNKLVKWDAFYIGISSDELKRKIECLEFLEKATKRFPLYFKHRNNYIEYINLKDQINFESINEGDIKEKEQLLSKYKEQKKELEIELEETFNSITYNMGIELIGTYHEKYQKICEDLNNNISSSLFLNVNSDIECSSKLRQFDVSYIVNSHEKKIIVNNMEQLKKLVPELERLQASYYAAASIYNNKKDSMLSCINLYEELDKKIVIIENELNKIQYKINLYKKFQLTKQLLSTDLDELEKIQVHALEVIEKKISESNINNFDDIEKQIIKYKAVENQEALNKDKLGKLISDIREAYELFGREVSKMSKGDTETNILRFTKQNSFLEKLIKLFEQDIINRCSYYFKAVNNEVRAYRVIKYDFWGRMFYSEEGDLLNLQNGLSGGTDSAMTVYSLATSTNNVQFGNILLVDEWGDVSASFHKKLIEKLLELNTFAFAIFIDVDDRYNLINTRVEGDFN